MLLGNEKTIYKLFSRMDFHENTSVSDAVKFYGLKLYSRLWSTDIPIFSPFEKLYGNIFTRLFAQSIMLERKVIYCLSVIVDCIFMGLYTKRYSYYIFVLLGVISNFDSNINTWNRMIDEGETYEDF